MRRDIFTESENPAPDEVRLVHCMGCAHAGDAGGDPWRAWCLIHRRMVSNTLPKACTDREPDELRAAARRREDHLARTRA